MTGRTVAVLAALWIGTNVAFVWRRHVVTKEKP